MFILFYAIFWGGKNVIKRKGLYTMLYFYYFKQNMGGSRQFWELRDSSQYLVVEEWKHAFAFKGAKLTDP